MEIEYLNENNKCVWDEFAMNSSMAWFRHTTAWLDYSSCSRFDSNTINKSFMVKQGKTILAIVPLLVEYSYPERTFNCLSMYGDYTPMPAYLDDSPVSREKILKCIEEEMEKIIQDENNNVKYGKFMIDPLIEYPYVKDFAVFDLLDNRTSIEVQTTNIVDLRFDFETILRKMRKGHKAAIVQVQKETDCRVDVFDMKNIDISNVLCFKAIHKEDAGYQTRTDESWICMYNWIKDGIGALVMLWSKSRNCYIAGALIMNYKRASYYASFATLDSDYLNGHVGHLIQVTIIKYLKAHGFDTYETGVNYVPGLQVDSDEKLVAIAGYKKGFRSAEYPKITYKRVY